MSENKDFISQRKSVKYLDLFAGAGGFSEGFMQAYTDSKYYDFCLASDINENCELTHRVRYNKMLGLKTKFLCQDIMEDSFLTNLLQMLGSEKIDVITGGPSCQSFSLAGRRKKLDKRDDLFYHYLKVIKALRPKYFIMENVKGILTKDEGRVKERILREIRSIIDDSKMSLLYDFISFHLKHILSDIVYASLCIRLNKEECCCEQSVLNERIFNLFEQQLKDITTRLPYSVSKSNQSVNTVRHGLQLLRMKSERDEIRKKVIQLKTNAHIDNDVFVDHYNAIIETISDEQLLESTLCSLEVISQMGASEKLAKDFKLALEIYTYTFDECVDFISSNLTSVKLKSEFEALLKVVRLYNIDKPVVLLSADYGVPQNRERVVFIGCRNDQPVISEIPPTVSDNEKVKVYEALWDLDMAGNGETVTSYRNPKLIKEYENVKLHRSVDGRKDDRGLLFSEWSRIGRLGHRFSFDMPPFYVSSLADLESKTAHQQMELFNHQTSSQNDTVRERLEIIVKHGDYENAKYELKEKGVDSQKRNYTVLNPMGQSPTVCTMPDDFIHYSAKRPTTVREMARLQSFDDSFVFQGKRQTGGNNRQKEIPQYTLVGNAVPPLMARAIANTILEHIKL